MTDRSEAPSGPVAGNGGPRPRSDIWVVVVNYGSHRLVEDNFVALSAGHDRTVHVVVVDNFSDTHERVAIRRICERNGWHLVEMEGNPGFAAGCNAGVRTARDAGAPSVILVNPDAQLTTPVAVELWDQTLEKPADLVAPAILTSDGGTYFQGIRLDLRSGRMRGRRWPEDSADAVYVSSSMPWRDWLTGACLAFSVSLWERAGGLDERYFLYWEDVDFSQRCVEVGAQLCLRRDLAVVHDEGATHGRQGSRARSSIYYYYNCRNRLIYARTHLPRGALLGWMLRTPDQSWQILLRGGRRQLLQTPKPLFAVLAGSLSGLAGALPVALRPLRRG